MRVLTAASTLKNRWFSHLDDRFPSGSYALNSRAQNLLRLAWKKSLGELSTISGFTFVTLPSGSSSGAKADNGALRCGAVGKKTSSTDHCLCSKPKPDTQASDSIDGRFNASTAVGSCCNPGPTPKAL